ncbi:type II secretion system F family protein [Marinomonas algicola]|uniref:type II secretion system F family protein n=1 Tax=Marinomonas algicola TaxID=2773454 RepID=UPI00174E1930|nr:type II secretion system F family protein [Marinomonas algicola]
MIGLYPLLFILCISLGVMFVFQSLFFVRNRNKKLTQALEGGNKGSNIFFKIKRYISSLFSINNDDIQEKFIAAGFYEARFAPYYFPLKYSFTVLFLLIVWYFGSDIETLNKIIFSMLILIGFIIVPDAYLDIKKRILSTKLSRQLPYLIDLLSVCVQTGLTIEASIFYLTKEMIDFDKDMAFMLKKVSDKSQISGIERSLNDLLLRVPTKEMRSFVFTLTQSIEYGTSIQTALDTLARDIRELQVLDLEEKVGKLSAKMSIPLILFIMFPIVILITAPGIMRMMGNV